MTVCVALTDGTKTFVASDTLWHEPGRVSTHEPKWILREPYAIGFAGNQPTFQLLMHGHGELTRALTDDPRASAWRFRESFVSFAARWGIVGSNRNGVLEFDCSIILASKSYVIEFDGSLGYTVARNNEFVAIGSGMAHARGAYFALRNVVGNPAELVKLCAAAAVSDPDVSDCRGEVWYNELI